MYIERERCIYIYICIYTYICIERERETMFASIMARAAVDDSTMPCNITCLNIF